MLYVFKKPNSWAMMFLKFRAMRGSALKFRTKLNPDAIMGSAGVGILVRDEVIEGAKVKVDRESTFGDCEGYISISIAKKNQDLTIINGYHEWDRPASNFKVDHKAYLTGLLDKFGDASRRPVRKNVKKYTYLCCDANVRLGQEQENVSCESDRRGELTLKGTLWAPHYFAAKEIGKNGGYIVHGRVCEWESTFCRGKRKKSMMMEDQDTILSLITSLPMI